MTPVKSFVYVFFLTTFLSGVASLSPPSDGFGNIFLNTGGVTTRGIKDLDSSTGDGIPDEHTLDFEVAKAGGVAVALRSS